MIFFLILIFCKFSFSEVYLTQEEALKLTLASATEIIEETKEISIEQIEFIKKEYKWKPEKTQFKFYVGKKLGEVIGTAFIIKQEAKHGPILLIVGIDLLGKVTDVRIMALVEQRGKPIKDKKFLDQFINKSIKDPIMIKKDIKAVTKATISSRGVAIGVKKAVILYNIFYLTKKE